MLRRYFVMAAASALLALSLAGTSPAEADTTYSGRAYAAFVNTTLTGPVYISDSGELPPSGGFKSDSLLTTRGMTPISSVLLADVLVASTSGASGKANSFASLARVTVLPGSFAQVTASFIEAQTEATCDGVSGSTQIAELMFGDTTVAVTGQPQRVDIPDPLGGPPLATLFINEQTSTSSGTYREVRVNALHLIVPGVAEVILSSAKSDINCQPPVASGPCHDFVTGGGWIPSGNSRANFGFNVGFKGGSSTPEVHFNYIDHSMGKKIRATSITVYVQGPTSTSRHFEGEAEVNGTPGYKYSIDVDDKGEPGRMDTLSLRLEDGSYANAGSLPGGNIQLHKPCASPPPPPPGS
jgi:hypothetical protein